MASTIVVSCPECNKQIKAPADLVGKRVRCKACGHAFAVPAAPAQAPAPKPAKPPDQEDEEGGAYHVTTAELKPFCPVCAHELESEDAVICLNCGFNMRTRQRVGFKKTHDITMHDRVIWLLPGFVCIAVIVALIVIDLLYFMWQPDEKAGWAWLAYGGFKTWGIIISLFFMFFAGRFAFKRVVLNPEPPEKEKN
jgi:hypothetical protein